MSSETGTEAALVIEATAGSDEAFRRLVEPLKRELHLFCYRMLGSFHDAEDVLQEAQLKAWRSLERYERRASFRTWMYGIVTNAALDALRKRRRRVLPQDLGSPRDPSLGLGEQRPDIAWMEPCPDPSHESGDPHTAVELRQSVRLAFVRVLQVLPPRQRAALILRDVLGWPAADVASTLDASVPAVNSALQRARRSVASSADMQPRPADEQALEPGKAEMLNHYVAAWEAGDMDAIVGLLTEDATHSMPPWNAWFRGRDALRALYSSYEVWGGDPGPDLFRIVPTPLNGDLGFAEYCRYERKGPYKALALTIATLDPSGAHISDKVSFVRADLFIALGLPPAID